MGKIVTILVILLIAFFILKWVLAVAMNLLVWGFVGLGFLAVGGVALKVLLDKK